MSAKKTPWFDGGVKPVRVGVYERKRHGESLYSRWDGSRWFQLCWWAHNALITRMPSDFQSLPWRGLAQDPKGKQ